MWRRWSGGQWPLQEAFHWHSLDTLDIHMIISNTTLNGHIDIFLYLLCINKTLIISKEYICYVVLWIVDSPLEQQNSSSLIRSLDDFCKDVFHISKLSHHAHTSYTAAWQMYIKHRMTACRLKKTSLALTGLIPLGSRFRNSSWGRTQHTFTNQTRASRGSSGETSTDVPVRASFVILNYSVL